LKDLGDFVGDKFGETGAEAKIRFASTLVIGTFGGGLIIGSGNEENDEHGDDEDN
jgi:hypothetical protein